MNELGKAESAFGKVAQEDYTEAAARAFGPKPPNQKAKNDEHAFTDPLRRTYDSLVKAARAKAQTYIRRGTGGAAEGLPSVSDVARDISSSREGRRYGSSAEPSYARGGSMGDAAQPTVDVDGSTVYLGDVDQNDDEAMRKADEEARKDLAWMRDNDFIVED